MHARTLRYHATVHDGLANRFSNPSQTRRIPVIKGLKTFETSSPMCNDAHLREIIQSEKN